MPEIKDTTNKPKSDAQFVLPARTFNAWPFIVPILLLIALAGGWFARAFVNQVSAPEAAVIEQPKEDEEEVLVSEAYYLTEGMGQNTETHIYSYSGNSAIADKKIADVDASYISVLEKFTEPNTYAVRSKEGDILVLNIITGKLSPLIKTEENGYTSGFAFSDDKKKIAYGVTYDGNPYQSEIWIYDLESKERTKLVEKTKMEMYQGYAPEAWINNDTELVVRAIGGDAGVIWGDIYTVNAATGALTTIAPITFKETQINTFLRGSLSPDKSKWLFEYCAAPEIKDDIPVIACPAGTEIRTYDFKTKQTKAIFQNLRYDNNLDKGILRTIMSVAWLDDKIIIAAVPGAILEIDATSVNKAIELFTYDGTVPQNFTSNFVSFTNLSKSRIVFQRGEDTQVLDRNSKKIETINLTDRKERVLSWLE